MYISLKVLGSLVLDIKGNKLDAKFLSSTGAVKDHFTIKKDTDEEGPDLVTVSFQDGVSPTSAYVGTWDTYISQDRPDTNFGTSGTLPVDGDDGDGKDISAILKWGSLNIPAGSVVKSATITLNVTNSSSGTYELYALKRNWVETETTWNRYASGSKWQTPGAKGTSDRETTVLGTVAASSTGKRTITLNTAGVALVQSWVDDPSKNQGFVLYDGSVSDKLAFDSSEASTASNRPKLTVTYAP